MSSYQPFTSTRGAVRAMCARCSVSQHRWSR